MTGNTKLRTSTVVVVAMLALAASSLFKVITREENSRRSIASSAPVDRTNLLTIQ